MGGSKKNDARKRAAICPSSMMESTTPPTQPRFLSLWPGRIRRTSHQPTLAFQSCNTGWRVL